MNHVSVSYTAEVDYVFQATASNGTTVGQELVPLDRIGAILGTISVPTNGSTTTEAVSSTL